MHPATLWWIIALVMAGAEMLTGTFFLLVMSTGAVAGAIAAYLGFDVAGQMVAAAVVGSVNLVVWHIWRSRRKPAPVANGGNNATRNKLDIGGVVQVQTWLHDGSTTVSYRGAVWTAVASDPAMPLQPGRHVVVDIRLNQLVLRPEH